MHNHEKINITTNLKPGCLNQKHGAVIPLSKINVENEKSTINLGYSIQIIIHRNFRIP
jgi:hypothetical protein